MLKNENKKENEQNLEKKLDNFLKNGNDCEGEECQIKDPEELVRREHKKIITNDGRQLLSEYTV
jgi:hypothetical protein